MYNFDIREYSKYDLEKLFQLPQDKPYNKSTLLEKKTEFFEKIANATTAQQQNPQLIQNLKKFLDEAHRLLVYFLPEQEDYQEKSIYPNPRPQPIPSHTSNQRHTPQYEFTNTQDPSQRNLAANRYTSNHLYDRVKDELIIPPNKPFKTVMQNEFNQGIINPLHTPILTKCLNIDTKFREEIYKTKSTDFIFTLPDRIRKVVSMRLSAYEFPTSSIYNISKSYGNNYLNVLCTYTPPPAPANPNNPQTRTVIKTVQLQDGTYTPEKLIETLNTFLQPRDPSTNTLINPNPDQDGMFNCIQFEFDKEETNKVKMITMSPPDFLYDQQILAIGFDFTLNENKEKDITTDIKTKIGWNLGFIRPKYYDNRTYTADTQINMDTIKYMYLMINDYNNSVNNNFFIGAFPKYVLNKNILARIPITPPSQQITNNYQIIQQENQLTQHMEPRRYFGPVDIQRLHIQLYDEFGRILDIDKANYSICLTFQCMYD